MLGTAVGVHVLLTLFFFREVYVAPRTLPFPVNFIARWCSANAYVLYASFDSAHYQVDFEGSNDGGTTWRSYDWKYLPQRIDEAPKFIAPWFPRFEMTVQIEGSRENDLPFLPLIASRLLSRDPEVMRRFAHDPFPDRPPTVIRMRRYRLDFTSVETYRHTNLYWRKQFDLDYTPALYRNAEGKIAQFSLAEADSAFKSGDYPQAMNLYQQQFHQGNLDAGFRIADLLTRVFGQPEEAFTLLSELVRRGEIKALHNLGLCYEYGGGVRVDYVKAATCYKDAADGGRLLSLYALGSLYVKDRIAPRDDVEGLSLLLRAAAQANGNTPVDLFIRNDQPTQLKRIMDRMSQGDILSGRQRAAVQR
jgi:tetratricopeptide (TPR) repeat protein